MREDLMVQQQVKSVWQHMVGVICLNQTSRHQVKRVLPEFFKHCPTPQSLLKTGPKILKEICPGVFGTIKPVGYCMIGKR